MCKYQKDKPYVKNMDVYSFVKLLVPQHHPQKFMMTFHTHVNKCVKQVWCGLLVRTKGPRMFKKKPSEVSYYY